MSDGPTGAKVKESELCQYPQTNMLQILCALVNRWASRGRSVKPNAAAAGGCVSKGRMGLSGSGTGDDAALRRDTATSARGLLHLSLRFGHRQIVVRLEGRIYSSVPFVLADHRRRSDTPISVIKLMIMAIVRKGNICVLVSSL
uniref:Uncharacterized protein n=1 Tax=Anopheles farauti TaxID=69004 RepID=A0A182QFY7_9DIPT